MKMIALSMGLALALTASASPPTLAVDKLPKDGNFNNELENSSAPAAEDITYEVVDQGNDIIIIMHFAPGQAIGQETVVVRRSDHTDGKRYILNPVLELMTSMMTVSNALPLAAVEPERSRYNVIMNGNYNDLDQSSMILVKSEHPKTCITCTTAMISDQDHSKTAAGLPLVGVAKHAPQMVPLPRHPAWTMPRYLRC
jgi:hypothetical protein